jgi:hypothetical protein
MEVEEPPPEPPPPDPKPVARAPEPKPVARAPEPKPVARAPEAKPAETLEQLLTEASGAGGRPEQRASWRKLRPFASEPRVDRLLAIWRARASEPGETGLQAIAVLGEVADVGSVAVLLDLLGTDDRNARAAVLAALRTATCHDFGPTRWRWTRWWTGCWTRWTAAMPACGWRPRASWNS